MPYFRALPFLAGIFPGGSDSKEPTCNARELGSIPGPGRSPGGGPGNPLQYSCLETAMDRGAWWATVRRVTSVRHDRVTERSTAPLVGTPAMLS